MRQFVRFCFLALIVFSTPYGFADQAFIERPDVKEFITKMVKEHHFNKQQLMATLKEAQFQPQIIESMDRPFEKKTWDVYKDLFLTQQRVQEGVQFWQNNQAMLKKAEKKYGVPANIIVAIVGVETLYGKHQGTYRVLDALTTLAFNYPKRDKFFRKELEEYLLLCREQKVSPTVYLGSYAGAIGKPQFMPSSYRFYAIDFTGKGTRDLINDDSDVIASVANYFHKHGWKNNEEVAQLAKVSGWRYKRIETNSKQPNYDLKHLIASGIKPTMSMDYYPRRAGLIELTTQQGPEYWLAFPNFYVITRYNTSPQYALVVYLLSQQLSSEFNLSPVKKNAETT